MKLPTIIPWWWKAGAVLALVAAVAAVGIAYRDHVGQLGHDAAVAKRSARDLAAFVGRVQDNAALALKQDAINITITETKHEELAPVRQRIAAERVRVGPAICGPAAPAETEDAGGSDGADSAGRLVRPDIDRDIRALKLKVEEALATGRACQAWGKENGFVP